MSQPDEVVVITDETCDPCRDLQARLARVPHVLFTDLNSPLAEELLGDQEEIRVPLPMARFGQRWQPCEVSQQGDQVVLICGEDVVPLVP